MRRVRLVKGRPGASRAIDVREIREARPRKLPTWPQSANERLDEPRSIERECHECDGRDRQDHDHQQKSRPSSGHGEGGCHSWTDTDEAQKVTLCGGTSVVTAARC